jgi:hypothetical protein
MVDFRRPDKIDLRPNKAEYKLPIPHNAVAVALDRAPRMSGKQLTEVVLKVTFGEAIIAAVITPLSQTLGWTQVIGNSGGGISLPGEELLELAVLGVEFTFFLRIHGTFPL